MATVTHESAEVVQQQEALQGTTLSPYLYEQLHAHSISRLSSSPEIGRLLLTPDEAHDILSVYYRNEDLLFDNETWQRETNALRIELKQTRLERWQARALAATILSAFILYAIADALALVGAS